MGRHLKAQSASLIVALLGNRRSGAAFKRLAPEFEVSLIAGGRARQKSHSGIFKSSRDGGGVWAEGDTIGRLIGGSHDNTSDET